MEERNLPWIRRTIYKFIVQPLEARENRQLLRAYDRERRKNIAQDEFNRSADPAGYFTTRSKALQQWRSRLEAKLTQGERRVREEIIHRSQFVETLWLYARERRERIATEKKVLAENQPHLVIE